MSRKAKVVKVKKSGARKVAAKAAKRAEAPDRKKAGVAKTRSATAAPKKSSATPNEKRAAPRQPVSQPSTPARESLSRKIGGAFKAIIDTLSDAEQLHRRLDPDPTRDPDPE